MKLSTGAEGMNSNEVQYTWLLVTICNTCSQQICVSNQPTNVMGRQLFEISRCQGNHPFISSPCRQLKLMICTQQIKKPNATFSWAYGTLSQKNCRYKSFISQFQSMTKSISFSHTVTHYIDKAQDFLGVLETRTIVLHPELIIELTVTQDSMKYNRYTNFLSPCNVKLRKWWNLMKINIRQASNA